MIFREKTYEADPGDIAAAEAPLAQCPFLPDDLDILVFYGGHTTSQDFAALQPYLATADIFIPELTSWTVERVALFSRISQGDKSARSELEEKHAGRKFTSFANAETRALLGSNVHVTPIDYAEHHARAREIENHFDNWGLIDLVVPNFNKTLNNIAMYARKEGDLESHREDIMALSVGPRLQTIIDSDPELQAKDRIRVVIQQGATHTFFYHQLVKMVAENETCAIERVFDRPKPVIFEHFDRLSRAFRADIKLNTEERRELAMRSLARTALRTKAIPLVLKSSDRRGIKLTLPPPEEMVERFSVESIKDFHARVVHAK